MTTRVEKKKKNVAVTRATGEKLLAGLLSRVEEVNRGDYAYYVGAVVLFGSFLTDKERPGDIDVGVDVLQKPDFKEHAERRVRLAEARGRDFSWWNQLWWPLREVIMFLKGGSKALSIHTMPGDVYELMKDPAFQYRLLFGRLRSAPDNTHY